jgi:hypothetical protein
MKRVWKGSGWDCVIHGKQVNIYIVLVENTKESRPTGKSTCRLEDTIKKNLKEICLENVKYSFGSEDVSAAGSQEHNNEASACINGGPSGS